MRLKRILISAISLAVVPVVASASASASATSAPPPSLGILRYAGDFPEAAAYWRYGYVVLNAWEHHYIDDLKAANPAVRVLVYKDMAACKYVTGNDPLARSFYSTGVGCQEADDGHQDWYLEDVSGQRIEWCDYETNWFMDPGLASYQEAWTENVLGELQEFGWDGVLIDDTMYSPRYHLCGRSLSKYPDDAAFGAATESFLARVGPTLASAGFEAIPNISDASPSVFGRWLSHVSGAMKEWWVATSLTVSSGENWSYEQEYLQITGAQDKPFLAVTTGSIDDRDLMSYARASFLLGWNGRNGALLYHAGWHVDPWSPEWTADVGAPIGDRYRVGKAWRRDFTGGTVIVNPSASSFVTLKLDGTYLTPRGSALRSVRLEPMSGTILSSDGKISLRAKRYRNPRRLKVALRWGGARSPRVTIERNGKILTRTRNDRQFRDIVRVGGQRYRYRVCELGSSRCSRKIRIRV